MDSQARLKIKLQDDTKASKLENLAAVLIGRLLGVPILVAKSGFQHGGDAGPAGQQGRRFRLECKKYSDTTSLSDRELLGEIDHALARDEALEAWFLVATRTVPEQLAQDLTKKGERIGVPVIILDWTTHELAPLAALCAFDPDLVEAEFSEDAGALARALQPISGDAIAALRRRLQSWCLGFEALRIGSHEKLEAIWHSPRTSNAELGQDAAGGAQDKKVRRIAVHEALYAWWKGPALGDAPAAVVGWEGVGKTWAVLNWLMDSKDGHPVVLIVPSSAVVALSSVSETGVKRFLADRLYELSGIRDSEHWLRRLDYLLKRPLDEGPVLTLFFDGLNQEPSVPWLALLKVLQHEKFAGRVRVIVTTRNHHFNDKLSKLRGLVVPAVSIAVDRYDATPGGELDQMLRFENLAQANLHPDLIDLARTPRLFKLVVRFRHQLVQAGQVTVHRLLWEYGRDTLGERTGRSFSESEWRAWLREIAQKYRDGIQEFSVKTLGETTNRPDLSEQEVYARLSDIIDGRFARTGPSGSLQLTPTVVAHALGASLLAALDRALSQTWGALEAELTQWLDPITGFDQRAEILRASVSILVQRGGPAASPMAGLLVTAWLQTQNVTDNHRQELAALAPNLTYALLDAVEHSDGHTHASARLWAVNALRAIPRTDAESLMTIVTRLRRWLSIVSRDVDPQPNADSNGERRRSNRLKQRIGTDRSGPITVLGVNLELVDLADGSLQAVSPSIIEGFPLARAVPTFEAAAVVLAIRGRNESWDGLKWLCLLNEVDPDETAAALRNSSELMRLKVAEPGVHPDLPARVAALLLCLSGREIDEDAAASIDPGLDHVLTYENDYLPRPGHSLFALERRHADIALTDTQLPLHMRVQRTKELWLDPRFEPPAAFIDEVRATVAGINVEKLDRHLDYTTEDHNFEQLEPVLARCAPDLLADLIRRKMLSMVSCPAESRYWAALRATDHLVLAGEAEAAAARALRLSAAEAEESRDSHAASQLLLVEIRDLHPQAQFDALISADLKSIRIDFVEVLRPPTPDDVDALIARYETGSSKQQHDLLILLSIHSIAFSDSAWSWLVGFTRHPDHELRGFAFKTLTHADAGRFGRVLVSYGWSWSPDANLWVNHYGTGALIEATLALPFDQLAPRLAPWRLLEAVRLRGADAAEVRLATAIFGQVLAAEKLDEPDLGSLLSIDRTEAQASQFIVSVVPRPTQEEADDPMAALKASMDLDAQIKARRRAAETAVSRITEARKAGASLYITNMDARDFEPVLRHASDLVDNWLEGLDESTADFRRRVHLAEGAFLALCEALLSYDPMRGVQLWRALRAIAERRYIGAAGVEDLVHMVFRVPHSPAVTALREELFRLRNCNTDVALFDIAVAASHNGKTDWLADVIKADRASASVWKRNRSVVLNGFTMNNRLPVAGAWPSGEIKTGHAELDRRSARFRWIEACARHWWRAYVAAHEATQAYAAWVLFLRSADRRAWVWMLEDVQAAKDIGPFFSLKLSHAQLGRSKLKGAMQQRADKLDESFLNRTIIDGVGPWAKKLAPLRGEPIPTAGSTSPSSC